MTFFPETTGSLVGLDKDGNQLATFPSDVFPILFED
jgi:hypothetical protein